MPMTVEAIREVINHEMGVGVRSTTQLLEKMKESDWDYRPADNMRTLRELVDHLAAIPEVDLAIMKEHSEAEIHSIEEKYAQLTSTTQLTKAMEDGFQHYKAYITSLSPEDYLTKETKPFYADFKSSQSKWHVETVTHLFHHRAQFFNYLKQLGYNVNMFDLYV